MHRHGTVISDNLEVEYAEAKKMALTAGIVVMENNPCFEIWPLLHFGLTTRSFANCDNVADELKRADRIPGYDKSRKFLVKARLYARYKERIATIAIPAAKHLEKERPIGNTAFYSSLFKFFWTLFVPPSY